MPQDARFDLTAGNLDGSPVLRDRTITLAVFKVPSILNKTLQPIFRTWPHRLQPRLTTGIHDSACYFSLLSRQIYRVPSELTVRSGSGGP